MGRDLQAVWIDVESVRARARDLADAGAALGREAGGVDRSVPAIPDDVHGLAGALIGFDEAREAFEQNLGRSLEALGDEVSGVVDGAVLADGARALLDRAGGGGASGGHRHPGGGGAGRCRAVRAVVERAAGG
jgi:hypothetical protein